MINSLKDNHLETDKHAKVDPEDIANYLTLNRHANLIVELNHERRQRFRVHITAWKARRAQNASTTTSTTTNSASPSPERTTTTTTTPPAVAAAASAADPDTACPEYEALVAMGSGIIAHVMLEYRRDRAGPWHKLMHQLVCEMPATEEGAEGAGEGAYERWRDWFEQQEHHEATGGRTPSYLRNVGTWS